jgi:hypothetical protein
MEGLELLGLLAIILGVIGMFVMLKGKRPGSRSTTESESIE